ncbi:hypothetical protein [Thermomonas fusca]|uniref:hypothetical protein n=1 Tax=Thermomonas fusca TaxID=215690 RepID=UPI000491C2D8|nr:hypothetical protein [Thermomonas fusca]
MKTFIQDFRTGTATQRIAMIADLASLLGVSAAAIAATLFSVSSRVHVGNVVFALAQSILFIGGLAIGAAAYWVVDHALTSRFHDAPFPRLMLRVAATCAFASAALISGFAFYEYLGSFRYIYSVA